jgi:hypothetical protein
LNNNNNNNTEEQIKQKEDIENMVIGLFDDPSFFDDFIPDIIPLPKPKLNHQD